MTLSEHYPHRLPQEDARSRIEQAFAEYRTRYAAYQPELTWSDAERARFAFMAKGVRVDGSLRVTHEGLDVEAKLPFVFRPFKKLALETVGREVDVWLRP